MFFVVKPSNFCWFSHLMWPSPNINPLLCWRAFQHCFSMNFAAPEGVVAEILGVHTNHHQGEIMGISWEHNNGISWYCIFGCFWSCRFNGEKWWSTVGFCSNKPWFTIFDLFRIEHNSWFAYPPVPIKHGKPLTKKEFPVVFDVHIVWGMRNAEMTTVTWWLMQPYPYIIDIPSFVHIPSLSVLNFEL